MTEERPTTESELVDFVRAIDLPAPDSLHRQVESLIAAHPSRGARRRARGARARAPAFRPWFAAAGALSAAVLAVAITLATAGGGGSPLSVSQASALTLRPATAPAPAERSHTQLAASVDGVSFPYWEERFGWRSTGARSDLVGGREVTTIFYANRNGQRIGYAIVAGKAPARPSGGVVAWRGGTRFQLMNAHGEPVVTWLRSGHLCVVSGRGVDSATMLRLASWS